MSGVFASYFWKILKMVLLPKTCQRLSAARNNSSSRFSSKITFIYTFIRLYSYTFIIITNQLTNQPIFPTQHPYRELLRHVPADFALLRSRSRLQEPGITQKTQKPLPKKPVSVSWKLFFDGFCGLNKNLMVSKVRVTGIGVIQLTGDVKLLTSGNPAIARRLDPRSWFAYKDMEKAKGKWTSSTKQFQCLFFGHGFV